MTPIAANDEQAIHPLIAAIATDLAVTRLTGPIWKLSERFGSDDDAHTHLALLCLVRTGHVEEKWVNGRPIFLRLMTINDHDLRCASHHFEKAVARLADQKAA